MPAPTVKNAWQNATASANFSVDVSGAGTLGGGAATSGDYLLYGVVSDSQFSTATYGAGYDTPTAQATTADAQELAVARKFAGSSEAGQSVTASTDSFIGGIVALTGVDGTTPMDVTPVVANINTLAASPRTLDASITPVTNNCRLIMIVGTDTNGGVDATTSASTVSGSTSGWTSLIDINNGFRNIAVLTATQTTAGALTARASSSLPSGTAGMAVILMAIRPSDPSGGGGGGGGGGTFPVAMAIFREMLDRMLGRSRAVGAGWKRHRDGRLIVPAWA